MPISLMAALKFKSRLKCLFSSSPHYLSYEFYASLRGDIWLAPAASRTRRKFLRSASGNTAESEPQKFSYIPLVFANVGATLAVALLPFDNYKQRTGASPVPTKL